jgi:hypothetical protein
MLACCTIRDVDFTFSTVHMSSSRVVVLAPDYDNVGTISEMQAIIQRLSDTAQAISGKGLNRHDPRNTREIQEDDKELERIEANIKMGFNRITVLKMRGGVVSVPVVVGTVDVDKLRQDATLRLSKLYDNEAAEAKAAREQLIDTETKLATALRERDANLIALQTARQELIVARKSTESAKSNLDKVRKDLDDANANLATTGSSRQKGMATQLENANKSIQELQALKGQTEAKLEISLQAQKDLLSNYKELSRSTNATIDDLRAKLVKQTAAATRFEAATKENQLVIDEMRRKLEVEAERNERIQASINMGTSSAIQAREIEALQKSITVLRGEVSAADKAYKDQLESARSFEAENKKLLALLEQAGETGEEGSESGSASASEGESEGEGEGESESESDEGGNNGNNDDDDDVNDKQPPEPEPKPQPPVATGETFKIVLPASNQLMNWLPEGEPTESMGAIFKAANVPFVVKSSGANESIDVPVSKKGVIALFDAILGAYFNAVYDHPYSSSTPVVAPWTNVIVPLFFAAASSLKEAKDSAEKTEALETLTQIARFAYIKMATGRESLSAANVGRRRDLEKKGVIDPFLKELGDTKGNFKLSTDDSNVVIGGKDAGKSTYAFTGLLNALVPGAKTLAIASQGDKIPFVARAGEKTSERAGMTNVFAILGVLYSGSFIENVYSYKIVTDIDTVTSNGIVKDVLASKKVTSGQDVGMTKEMAFGIAVNEIQTRANLYRTTAKSTDKAKAALMPMVAFGFLYPYKFTGEKSADTLVELLGVRPVFGMGINTMTIKSAGHPAKVVQAQAFNFFSKSLSSAIKKSPDAAELSDFVMAANMPQPSDPFGRSLFKIIDEKKSENSYVVFVPRNSAITNVRNDGSRASNDRLVAAYTLVLPKGAKFDISKSTNAKEYPTLARDVRLRIRSHGTVNGVVTLGVVTNEGQSGEIRVTASSRTADNGRFYIVDNLVPISAGSNTLPAPLDKDGNPVMMPQGIDQKGNPVMMPQAIDQKGNVVTLPPFPTAVATKDGTGNYGKHSMKSMGKKSTGKHSMKSMGKKSMMIHTSVKATDVSKTTEDVMAFLAATKSTKEFHEEIDEESEHKLLLFLPSKKYWLMFQSIGRDELVQMVLTHLVRQSVLQVAIDRCKNYKDDTDVMTMSGSLIHLKCNPGEYKVGDLLVDELQLSEIVEVRPPGFSRAFSVLRISQPVNEVPVFNGATQMNQGRATSNSTWHMSSSGNPNQNGGVVMQGQNGMPNMQNGGMMQDQSGMMQGQNGMQDMQNGGMMQNQGGMQNGGMMMPNQGGMMQNQGGMMPNQGGVQNGGMMQNQGGMMPNQSGMQNGGIIPPYMNTGMDNDKMAKDAVIKAATMLRDRVLSLVTASGIAPMLKKAVGNTKMTEIKFAILLPPELLLMQAMRTPGITQQKLGEIVLFHVVDSKELSLALDGCKLKSAHHIDVHTVEASMHKTKMPGDMLRVFCDNVLESMMVEGAIYPSDFDWKSFIHVGIPFDGLGAFKVYPINRILSPPNPLMAMKSTGHGAGSSQVPMIDSNTGMLLPGPGMNGMPLMIQGSNGMPLIGANGQPILVQGQNDSNLMPMMGANGVPMYMRDANGMPLLGANGLPIMMRNQNNNGTVMMDNNPSSTMPFLNGMTTDGKWGLYDRFKAAVRPGKADATFREENDKVVRRIEKAKTAQEARNAIRELVTVFEGLGGSDGLHKTALSNEEWREMSMRRRDALNGNTYIESSDRMSLQREFDALSNRFG